TKSITSALIGIAIDKGFIQHENTGVLEFFPDYNVANLTGAKQSMTLRHLLMMASGLNARDSYLYNWVGLNNMINSSDWIQYMLDLPMVSSPGSTFDYSNGSSYLLAAILQRATQQTAMGFASTNLFSPLGIHNRYLVWPVSPQGVVYGWGGMRMRPTDAAKFGFLYLHKGLWEGNQVISEEWVEKSTRTQINAGTLAEGYGFQWWVDAGGYFMAMGYGGQYIIVNRARNLLVVFTSALKDGDFFLPETLYNQYIFDSIRSDGAIAGNSQQQTRLENVVQRIAHPEPEPVPPLPSTAAVISGKTFYFEPNPYNYEFIGLDFTPGSDEVQLRYFYRDNFPRDFRLPVGLDNVYRTTWEHAYWRSFKGRWEGDSTFVLDYQRAGFTEWGTIRMVFNGNSVNVQFHNQRNGNQWEADAHLRSILPDKLPPPGTALFH
ncbi:MAG: serine hydrolase, partial [bacterium]|nr:serine hydrolase [bacterium]